MAVGAEQSSYSSARFTLSDYRWPEVSYINNHAVFMEYLWRIVAGLGVLIFTWSTVVLLGGFVSLLDKMDFWCLTMITLCQTKEAASAIAGGSIEGLYGISRFLSTAFSIAEPPDGCNCLGLWAFLVITHVIVPLFRLLVFTAIVFPLVVVYSFGICISMAISLYRLMQRDLGLGSADGDVDGTNLQKAALHVLYLLALVQGVLYFYGMTFISTGRKMERKVAKEYGLADFSIRRYTLETRDGCMKDPSFAGGRNLVTYAVSLIESAPIDTDKLLDGVRIMDTLISVENMGTGYPHGLHIRLEIGGGSDPYIM